MTVRSASLFAALGLAAMLTSGDANAAQTSGKIAHLQVDAQGNFSFSLAGTPNLCSNGNTTNQRGAVVVGVRGVTADGSRALYSMIMSAFLAGKTVHVFTDETVTTTGWGCTVYSLDVY